MNSYTRIFVSTLVSAWIVTVFAWVSGAMAAEPSCRAPSLTQLNHKVHEASDALEQVRDSALMGMMAEAVDNLPGNPAVASGHDSRQRTYTDFLNHVQHNDLLDAFRHGRLSRTLASVRVAAQVYDESLPRQSGLPQGVKDASASAHAKATRYLGLERELASSAGCYSRWAQYRREQRRREELARLQAAGETSGLYCIAASVPPIAPEHAGSDALPSGSPCLTGAPAVNGSHLASNATPPADGGNGSGPDMDAGAGSGSLDAGVPNP